MKSLQGLGLQLLHIGTVSLAQRMPNSCVTRAVQPAGHLTAWHLCCLRPCWYSEMEEERDTGRSRKQNGNRDCRKVFRVSWDPPPDRILFKGGGHDIMGGESWGNNSCGLPCAFRVYYQSYANWKAPQTRRWESSSWDWIMQARPHSWNSWHQRTSATSPQHRWGGPFLLEGVTVVPPATLHKALMIHQSLSEKKGATGDWCTIKFVSFLPKRRLPEGARELQTRSVR